MAGALWCSSASAASSTSTPTSGTSTAPRIDNEKWQADYEKTLLPFENTPQPKIVAVKLDVDIHPHAPRIDTKGVYVIENRTGKPLKEIHVRFDRDLKVLGLSIEGARPKQTFERFNYRIFAFDTPMQPGERRKMSFITLRAQKGFPNSGPDTRVVDNGTFINNQEIAPILGMSATACCRTAPSAASTACRPSCAWPSWATSFAPVQRPAPRRRLRDLRHHRHHRRRPDADRAGLQGLGRPGRRVGRRARRASSPRRRSCLLLDPVGPLRRGPRPTRASSWRSITTRSTPGTSTG
jgi:hypothetical protein